MSERSARNNRNNPGAGEHQAPRGCRHPPARGWQACPAPTANCLPVAAIHVHRVNTRSVWRNLVERSRPSSRAPTAGKARQRPGWAHLDPLLDPPSGATSPRRARERPETPCALPGDAAITPHRVLYRHRGVRGARPVRRHRLDILAARLAAAPSASRSPPTTRPLPPSGSTGCRPSARAPCCTTPALHRIRTVGERSVDLVVTSRPTGTCFRPGAAPTGGRAATMPG